jgi:Arginase family
MPPWNAITLGGDHSLGMGTVSGTCAAHKNVGVIWVDAHAVPKPNSGHQHVRHNRFWQSARMPRLIPYGNRQKD